MAAWAAAVLFLRREAVRAWEQLDAYAFTRGGIVTASTPTPAVREHRRARQPGRLGRPGAGCGARRDGEQSSDTFSRFNGVPAASLGIYLTSGANAVATSKAIAAALERSKRYPPDLTHQIVFDTTTFVDATIAEVLRTLAEAFALVVIVVFLFLGNWRATLVPIVAVPVSLVGAFAVLIALGYSANTITLLALVLAIGIVVDDAIVVVENVQRVMEEENLPAADAARNRAQILGVAVSDIFLALVEREFRAADPDRNSIVSRAEFKSRLGREARSAPPNCLPASQTRNVGENRTKKVNAHNRLDGCSRRRCGPSRARTAAVRARRSGARRRKRAG
jgi:AcrB/AcrD/AcrF family